jgi:hypothetical protein
VPGLSSFDKLQVEGDADAVHLHNALINQLLVRDVSIHELVKGASRADELDGLGRTARIGAELIQDRDVIPVERRVGRNFIQGSFS